MKRVKIKRLHFTNETARLEDVRMKAIENWQKDATESKYLIMKGACFYGKTNRYNLRCCP